MQREACAAVLRAFGVTRSNGGDGAAPPMEPPAADGLAKGGTALIEGDCGAADNRFTRLGARAVLAGRTVVRKG